MSRTYPEDSRSAVGAHTHRQQALAWVTGAFVLLAGCLTPPPRPRSTAVTMTTVSSRARPANPPTPPSSGSSSSASSSSSSASSSSPSTPTFLGVCATSQSGATGARVVHVGEGTGAEQAGLIPGDVIEEVRGESIADAAELMHEIARYARGRRVRVVFTRDGSRMEVRAMLGQGQPAECPASAFWE